LVPTREARFFGRRGFNQHVVKYFLSNHQPLRVAPSE
jgi:hypothetical protein